MTGRKLITQHIQLAYHKTLKTLGKPFLNKQLAKEQKQELLFQAIHGRYIDLQANKRHFSETVILH